MAMVAQGPDPLEDSPPQPFGQPLVDHEEKLAVLVHQPSLSASSPSASSLYSDC